MDRAARTAPPVLSGGTRLPLRIPTCPAEIPLARAHSPQGPCFNTPLLELGLRLDAHVVALASDMFDAETERSLTFSQYAFHGERRPGYRPVGERVRDATPV